MMFANWTRISWAVLPGRTMTSSIARWKVKSFVGAAPLQIHDVSMKISIHSSGVNGNVPFTQVVLCINIIINICKPA
jgi:hypothetical protein